eukprot:6397659-Prymnesium_polylepis.1
MQLVIIIIFIGTICIHIFDEWVDRADGAVATQVMGFTSGREIATMVIICKCGGGTRTHAVRLAHFVLRDFASRRCSLVLLPAPFLGLCVYKAVRMETIQTLRLSGMNELPELALDKGCFFHLLYPRWDSNPALYRILLHMQQLTGVRGPLCGQPLARVVERARSIRCDSNLGLSLVTR